MSSNSHLKEQQQFLINEIHEIISEAKKTQNSLKIAIAHNDQQELYSLNNKLKTLNEILGQEKYDSKSEISKKQICCIQEFILRIYDRENKNNKRWFLSPAEAVLIDIEGLKF